MSMIKIAFDLGVALARNEAGFECLSKQAGNQLEDLTGKLKNTQWPWQKKEPSGFASWKPYAVGGALGLGAYGLLRHKFLADPKRFPGLRHLQEMSGGEMLRAGLPEQPRNPTWWQKLYRSTVYGPEVWGNKFPRGTGVKPPKAIFEGNSPEFQTPGTFDPYSLGLKGKDLEEFHKTQQKYENKLLQAELLQKHAPGAMADTHKIEDIIKEYNLRLGEDTLAEDLPKLQEALKHKFGGKNYLLKTRNVREGGDPMTTSVLESFPDQNTDLVKSHEGWKKIRDEFHSLRKLDTTEAMRAFRRDPAFQGRVVEELLHNNVIAQERLPIRQFTGSIAENMKKRGFSPVEEYRVHVIGGKASPHLALPRNYSDPLHAGVGYAHTSRQAADYAQGIVDKLPPKHRNMTMAIDVAPMETGGFRVIELNPGISGLLSQPGMNPALYREVTGHSTPAISALGGVAAAGIGTGATGMAMGPKKDSKKGFNLPKLR